ncbi:MAG TPA: phage Gp37/Gp68 family protein [bacterium]|nr:phage Gp37/Gp68 family protein [bacterium]
MSGKTNIEWAEKVWNPTIGCTRVSPGCAHCYAFDVHDKRHKGYKDALARGEKPKLPPQYAKPFKDFQFFGGRLQDPMHWRKPARIFVNSMSDVFHERMTIEFWSAMVTTMTLCPQHQFLILTKRADRMMDFCQQAPPPPNAWMGVTVENQKAADERIPYLLKTPAAVRWLSVEPMLERIKVDFGDKADAGVLIKWVVCGGESGPKSRSFNIEWARDLRDQCQAAGSAFFMKQLGAKPMEDVGAPEFGFNGFAGLQLEDRKGGKMDEWPEDLRIREYPQ